MKKRFAVLLAASAAAISVPAAAQDSEFTGPWVGIVGGYDINKAGSTVDDDVNEENNETANGFAYGAQVGYDIDLNGFVVGAEAEFTDSAADTVFRDSNADFGLGSVDAGRDLYVGARVGYAVMPQTLVYAKAGYTNARYKFVGSDGEVDYDARLDTDGWRIGAGVEQKLGSNAFAKLEYRYSNYSRGEIDFEAEDIADSDRFDIDTDRHQIMAGVGYRF